MSHGDTIETIARIAHEVNRAYCQALGDQSQPPWEETPPWQRDAIIDGVRFHIDHDDAGPEASHENWRAGKIADGWTYGSVKDLEKKQHPCLVSFDKLPREQQAKSYLFRAIVHAVFLELNALNNKEALARREAARVLALGQATERRMKEENDRLGSIITKAAVEIDPECPDSGAYVDGHCSLAEAAKAMRNRLRMALDTVATMIHAVETQSGEAITVRDAQINQLFNQNQLSAKLMFQCTQQIIKATNKLPSGLKDAVDIICNEYINMRAQVKADVAQIREIAKMRPLSTELSIVATAIGAFSRRPNGPWNKPPGPETNQLLVDAEAALGRILEALPSTTAVQAAPAPVMVHDLKTWPVYFDAIATGEKTFEVRKDDRTPAFAVDHILHLREWNPTTGQYTGREARRRVTYVLRGTEHLAPGYCVLGLAANLYLCPEA